MLAIEAILGDHPIGRAKSGVTSNSNRTVYCKNVSLIIMKITPLLVLRRGHRLLARLAVS